jgi:hypothetical protein
LRLTGCKLGFLLNFGEALMKRGITRVVNGLEDWLNVGVLTRVNPIPAKTNLPYKRKDAKVGESVLFL